jgi:predicted O-linked N-acetylglucosamine transferase (SPINDLY family)
MNAQGTLQRAFAAHQGGNLAEAEFLYKAVLAVDKKQFDAMHMLGVIEGQRGNYDEALRRITKALRIRPNSAEAYANLGRMQGALADYPHAAESYKKALALNPRFALANNNYGIVLRRLKRFEEALGQCDLALKIDTNYADAWANRGNILCDLRRFDEALASYDRAIQLNPAQAEALLGRGNVMDEFQRAEEALLAYDRAIAVNPRLAAAWFGRGAVLNILKRPEESFIAFDNAFVIEPKLEFAEGQRLYTKMKICDWRDLDAECAHLVSVINGGALVALPLVTLSVSSSPAVQLKSAKDYAARIAASKPLWQGEKYGHDRIRIAYLSADFREHPVAHLLAGVIERHNRARFETIAVSFGPDTEDAARARLKSGFERFIDVRLQDDTHISRLLRELEVDIAVDLMGHTAHARPGVFASRPVPIQVNYLGYAGTSGASFIDYILADRCVIPQDRRQFYSEATVYLPETFMATDSTRAIADETPSRTSQGLPEHGFVFCAFGQSQKITPAVYSVWMRLLHSIENSVLWLSAMDKAATNNLRREAAAFGVEADRLVFAPRMERHEDHLARHRIADLFLDTQPYNAHATAVDALWAGLPIVTCLGSAFAGRVAGSLLNAVGLPEFVTASLEEYEALALKIARDPSLCASLKQKLARNRGTSSLFNTERFTHHIEAAYGTMWLRHQSGEAPQAFSVEPID